MGRRLFFDRCSPAQIHGKEPDLCGQIRTSSNGKPVDPDDPAVLVRKLESTAGGVCWMIDRWDELLQMLKAGTRALAGSRPVQGSSPFRPTADRSGG